MEEQKIKKTENISSLKRELRKTQIQIFINKIKNKLIPFGDKYRSCMKMDYLLHREMDLYDKIEMIKRKKDNKDNQLKHEEEKNIRKEDRQQRKQELKIIRNVAKNVAGAITEATYDYIRAEGYTGTKKKIQRMIYKLQLKELRLGIIYKCTPFGDKEQLEKKLKLVEESEEELFQMTLGDNPDIRQAKKIKCMKK